MGVLVALSLVAVVSNSRGTYIGDNRFAFFWSPLDLLGRHLSIWEARQGLGRVRWDFWPAPTAALALVRGVGFGPAAAERIWHATLLTSAGCGALAVVRHFRPRIGVEHWTTALLYTFNPFSAVFLVPSSLFLGYVLAPWFLVCFLNGVKGERPWRWAAVFGLLVFVPGNINYPAVVFAAFPLVPALLYVVLVERTARWRRVGGWVLGVAVLSLLVSTAGLVTSHYSSAINAENLAGTERPRDISTASSWSESWRGLGFWLVYWGDVRGLILPQFARYFWTPFVLVTYAAPCAALTALWRSRWRPRLLFGAVLLLGLVLMVGAYPVSNPSPYGEALLWASDKSRLLLSLRSNHKAGAIAMLGMAVLVGVTVAGIVAWIRTRRPRLVVPTVGAIVLVFLMSSFPFWSGKLYSPLEGVHSIPRYWRDAIRWTDNQRGAGRVLLLPSTVDGVYRWGSTGSDMVEGLLRRPLVTRELLALWQGTKEAANLVAALDEYLGAARYEPGVLAPIARRLGIRWVLVRNDLKWSLINRPRPASFEALRADTDLRLVRTFGRAGQNVNDQRFPDPVERTLPPVEVYAVRAFAGVARVETAPPLVVSGDGGAWPGLSRGGLLDRGGPVRYAAAAATPELEQLLASGSAVVITDSNRRRVPRIPLFDSVARSSYTLAAGQRPDPSPEILFDRSGSESVAWFRDAKRIEASAYGLPRSPQADLRPSNAFDGDPATAWRLDAILARKRGQWVRVTFRRPRVLHDLELLGAPAPTTERNPDPLRITRVTARLSDGTSVPAELVNDRARVELPARRTTSLTIRIDEVDGAGHGASAGFGLAEVRVPGLDLRETIQVPDDVERRAHRAPRLRSLLERAPLTYQFGSAEWVYGREVEPVLRRRFRVVGDRQYALRAELDLYLSQADDAAALLRADARASQSICRDAGFTVDGRAMAVRVDESAPLRSNASLPDRATVPVLGCAPVTLDHGWHTFTTSTTAHVRRAWLSVGDRPPLLARPGGSVTLSQGRDDFEVRGTAPRPAFVVAGQSASPNWVANIDGRSAGHQVSLDTQAAWRVDRGRFRLTAEIGVQRIYRVALAVTGLFLVLCLVLVVRGRLC